jgi:cytochrome c5
MEESQKNTGKKELLNGLAMATKAIIGIVLILMAVTAYMLYQLGPGQNATLSETQVVQKKAADAQKQSPSSQPTMVAETGIVDGKDVQTGLLAGEGLQIVRASCTSCHSSALILQNRFTREGWHEKIVWMQETQGLWDLGENESVILDYLAAHYSPEEIKGRRRPLENIEWFRLKD